MEGKRQVFPLDQRPPGSAAGTLDGRQIVEADNLRLSHNG
jgi:hypothetical protein